MKDHYTIALVGNPNCGKTSIFNALTGAHQHVGNYPGVTVDSKSGSFVLRGIRIDVIDLPGVYSLSSSSPEEEIAFQELTTRPIDMLLNVLDATILQRSLYLTTQLAELHIPMLLAFNMSDDATRRGLVFDFPKLERYFGSPIVQTVGSSAAGVRGLLDRLYSYLPTLEEHGVPMLSYGGDIDDAIGAITERIDALHLPECAVIPSRFYAIKLLEHDSCVRQLPAFRPVYDEVEAQIRHLLEVHAIVADTFMADCRYAMLNGACRGAITYSRVKRQEISDKIDLVMTNRYLGLPLFLLIMFLTFWFSFTCAEPLMGLIEDFFGWLGGVVQSCWPEGQWLWMRDLLADGIIGGVGGVLVFLPNILFLFFAISILEDSGYMSRAAFVMDGIMRKFGLQGRSFVPLVLGFGCNVPAIMATRCIESRRDRTVTILVLPLMSCGARLPIYALFIPAFFPHMQATMMMLIYVIGVALALFAAWLMKRTLFNGAGEVYLMELPPYRMPTWRSTLRHMWDRGKEYLHKASTIILFTSIILFICNTWPIKQELPQTAAAVAAAEEAGKPLDEAQVEALEGAERMEYTISGRLGHTLEPFFRPAGFDWRIVTSSIGALAAKELFVSQLSIIYAAEESEGGSVTLRENLQNNYTRLQAFCIMLFCLLSIPCMATLAVIRKELDSWKMMIAEAIGLFLLAYVMTVIAYQVGSLFV